MLLLLLKSIEFDDGVALLLSVAGLVIWDRTYVTSKSEIGGTDSVALIRYDTIRDAILTCARKPT